MADFDNNRFASKKQDWETPNEIFVPLNQEFGFELDVAASPLNAKCERYYTENDNALSLSWHGTCWLNPPYWEVSKWVKKAYLEARDGNVVVMLLQARTNTNWWHHYVMGASEVRFIKGRPKFRGARHGLPQPLVIVVFKEHQGPTMFSSFSLDNIG